MWELYAFWAWVGVVTAAAAARDGLEHGERWGALVAFLAIASGGLACIPAGWLADRHGKDRVARWALAGSLGAGLLAAMAWGQSFPLLVAALLLWGLTIVPDSPQFTAMVADRAPPEWVGSIMTLQTALGFLLTTLTVQAMPALAAAAGWPVALAALAIGPALGLVTLGRGS